MSVQPSETESTEDFRDSNLVLGLAVAAAMAFAWWRVMDLLQVSYSGRAQDAGISQQLVTVLRNTFPNGFWVGTLLLQPRTYRPPLRTRLSLAIIGALVGGLLYVVMGATRILLEAAFGEAVGGTIFWTLFGILVAFGFSSTGVIALETKAKSMSFREYWPALFRLGRRATLRWIVWTVYGGFISFLIGLALNHIISQAEFILLILPVASWGLWWGKPAIVFNSSRRNNAIRTIAGLVAIVGPILLMTISVPLGLLMLVSVILLYAVMTLRK
ncbi:MAG: hypothetical protein HY870_23585 [Chloroflexi bacterium]|nr:hypothetical protein [Chloroflexota bacterium]